MQMNLHYRDLPAGGCHKTKGWTFTTIKLIKMHFALEVVFISLSGVLSFVNITTGCVALMLCLEIFLHGPFTLKHYCI